MLKSLHDKDYAQTEERAANIGTLQVEQSYLYKVCNLSMIF